MDSKGFAIMLANEKAAVIVADYDNDGCKRYVTRRVIGHNSLRQGKATLYGVELDLPLNDGITGINTRFVLAYNTTKRFDLTKLRHDLIMERERNLFDIDTLNISCSEAIHKLALIDF